MRQNIQVETIGQLENPVTLMLIHHLIYSAKVAACRDLRVHPAHQVNRENPANLVYQETQDCQANHQLHLANQRHRRHASPALKVFHHFESRRTY